MKFQSRNPPRAEFQIAPMIDVVFLLLIFFIVTWKFKLTERDLKVKVPTSSEGVEGKRSPSEIIINVREGGRIFVNAKELTRKELGEKLTAIAQAPFNKEDPSTLAGAAGQPVRIRADSTCIYQNIVDVIDICGKSGIWNISFATQRPSLHE